MAELVLTWKAVYVRQVSVANIVNNAMIYSVKTEALVEKIRKVGHFKVSKVVWLLYIFFIFYFVLYRKFTVRMHERFYRCTVL